MFSYIFYEVSVLLLIAAVIGFIGLKLRQPLIVSFILVGILSGPSVWGVTEPSEYLDLLAHLGISLLLFIVGLKLDLSLIRTTGSVALLTGLGQVIFTSVVGFFLCLMLGLTHLESLYVAVALTFSSTIIIVKLLSDKGEVESLHGRIALGFLIVQDLVVVLMMITLSAIGMVGGEVNLLATLGGVFLKGVLFLVFIALFIRYLSERLLRQVARTQELMLLCVVAWAVALASLTDTLGFSKELGALFAGVCFASTTYRDALASRLAGLRDFLLLFFFINLGAQIDLAGLERQLPKATLLSLFVLIGNPIIVLTIMGMMGYRKRTGFLAGLTVAQISEFSLVFIALGLSLGQVGPDMLSLVTLVGLITIALSTYMILYSHSLYERLAPLLGIFERKHPHREESDMPAQGTNAGGYEVIIIGMGRYGSNLARHLNERGVSVLGVDYDPEVIRRGREKPHPVLYGDATDPEFLATLPLKYAKCVIITTPVSQNYLIDIDPHMTMIHTFRAWNYAGRILITARSAADVPRFERAGADVVLYPYADAAEQAAERVQALI